MGNLDDDEERGRAVCRLGCRIYRQNETVQRTSPGIQFSFEVTGNSCGTTPHTHDKGERKGKKEEGPVRDLRHAHTTDTNQGAAMVKY